MYHENTRDIGRANMYASGWRAKYLPTAGEIAQYIVKYPNSPCMWANGDRKKANFRCADWIGLDFDEGMTLEEAKTTFEPFLHVIGTTKSHQKDKNGKVCDRFRVFLKLADRITDPEQMELTTKKLVRKYGADSKATDNARMFWPCEEVVVCKYHGKIVHPISIEEMQRIEERRKRSIVEYEQRLQKYYAPSGSLPSRYRRMLEHGVPDGDRNNRTFQIAKELAKVGRSESDVFHEIFFSNIWGGNEKERREVQNTVSSAFR
jgi:hypothetical protein